jgi:hypothetical protein
MREPISTAAAGAASTETAEQIADKYFPHMSEGYSYQHHRRMYQREICKAAITEATAKLQAEIPELETQLFEKVQQTQKLQAERDAFDKEMVIAQTALAAERAQNEGLREALDRSMNALCGVYPYLPSERGDPELAQAISNADIIILPWVNRNEAT